MVHLFRDVLGAGISLVEIAPYIAISFGGYEILKTYLPENPGPVAKLGVGWCAGVTASLCCYPLDTVKRRMMTDGAGLKPARSLSLIRALLFYVPLSCAGGA